MTKILIIEDEAQILENVIEILEMESFHVRGAANGRRGLEIATEFVPDLIICDIMMPEVNGYDVLMELQNSPELSVIPFIFLTARASRVDIRKGMSLGADDYLTKPFSAPELLQAVSARLGKRETLANVYSQQVEELRESFMMAVPHEVRTPLSGIMGYSSMMIEDHQSVPPEEILKMSQRIYNAAVRLHHLFENYLLYAQIEIMSRDPRRMASLKEHRTNYPSVIIHTIALARAEAYNRHPDLLVELVDAEVQIAEDSLGKIAEELIDNAFKFSKGDTTVHVTSTVANGNYCLQIIDQGRGMSDEAIARIGAYMQFERKIHEQQGVGLGLILARKFTEVYSGRLTIERVLEQGTTVTVLLPLSENKHGR